MTDGWIDRQLQRAREDYERLPPWQKTAKSSDNRGPRGTAAADGPARDQQSQVRQEAKAPQK